MCLHHCPLNHLFSSKRYLKTTTLYFASWSPAGPDTPPVEMHRRSLAKKDRNREITQLENIGKVTLHGPFWKSEFSFFPFFILCYRVYNRVLYCAPAWGKAPRDSSQTKACLNWFYCLVGKTLWLLPEQEYSPFACKVSPHDKCLN